MNDWNLKLLLRCSSFVLQPRKSLAGSKWKFIFPFLPWNPDSPNWARSVDKFEYWLILIQSIFLFQPHAKIRWVNFAEESLPAFSAVVGVWRWLFGLESAYGDIWPRTHLYSTELGKFNSMPAEIQTNSMTEGNKWKSQDAGTSPFPSFFFCWLSFLWRGFDWRFVRSIWR